MSNYAHLDRSVHISIRRWVVWWFCLGMVCGAIAIANIVSRDLSRTEEAIILLMGAMHWALGGLVCYACDAIRIDDAPLLQGHIESSKAPDMTQWLSASEFVLPGTKSSLFPPGR